MVYTHTHHTQTHHTQTDTPHTHTTQTHTTHTDSHTYLYLTLNPPPTCPITFSTGTGVLSKWTSQAVKKTHHYNVTKI